MENILDQIHETEAAAAFSEQAGVFDATYTQDTIIQYKRRRVREHVESFLKPGSHILELNAGTGEDAIYFAEQGHTIHATDIATGMLEKLNEKVNNKHLSEKVTSELCSYTCLENLTHKGPYDHVFSNFAGVNCTNRLDKVLGSFAHLLNKNGTATLVVLPKFCLWECMLLFRGKVKTALRRFSGKKGTSSHIDGKYFTCWYYNPSYIITHLEKDFDVILLEGLCTIVPPSYLLNFAEKYPRTYAFLCGLENAWRFSWPWKTIGDYYIISLRKK